MKTILKIAAVVSLAAATACGNKGPAAADVLDEYAVRIDSVIGASEMPIASYESSVVDGKDLKVAVAISDSAINVNALGDELFEYFTAQQLRAANASRVNHLAKALTDTGGEMEVVLTDVYGNTKSFNYDGNQLRTLQSTPRSQLPVGQVKNQVADLFNAYIPNSAAHKGAEVTTSIEKSFITYNIRWKNVASYRSLTQGNLAARYLEPTKAVMARFGKLYPEIVEMMKSLGIDGVRYEYSSDDSDYVIRQAFPWREL